MHTHHTQHTRMSPRNGIRNSKDRQRDIETGTEHRIQSSCNFNLKFQPSRSLSNRIMIFGTTSCLFQNGMCLSAILPRTAEESENVKLIHHVLCRMARESIRALFLEGKALCKRIIIVLCLCLYMSLQWQLYMEIAATFHDLDAVLPKSKMITCILHFYIRMKEIHTRTRYSYIDYRLEQSVQCILK